MAPTRLVPPLARSDAPSLDFQSKEFYLSANPQNYLNELSHLPVGVKRHPPRVSPLQSLPPTAPALEGNPHVALKACSVLLPQAVSLH